jgi:hypothetical protein
MVEFEKAGESACRHTPADLVAVTSVIEEVRVDVEGDRDACVSKDAADLGDVEARSTIR